MHEGTPHCAFRDMRRIVSCETNQMALLPSYLILVPGCSRSSVSLDSTLGKNNAIRLSHFTRNTSEIEKCLEAY